MAGGKKARLTNRETIRVPCHLPRDPSGPVNPPCSPAGFALVCTRYGHGNTTVATEPCAAAADSATGHRATTCQTPAQPGLDDCGDHTVPAAGHQFVRESYPVCFPGHRFRIEF